VAAGLPPLLVVAGPTATGKTGLSLRLAEELRSRGVLAEIISADSRQVFRGLDIGTAKVSAADRNRVTHHGLDLADPDEAFSVADFAAAARESLTGIAERGGMAILVGGTGFYLRAVGRGLDTAALPHDAGVRARVEAEIRDDGLRAAVTRLTGIAPATAARTDLRNPRRVARALELAELQGDVPLPQPRGYAGGSAWIGLDTDPGTHDAWVADRARAQFDAGLIDEARDLRERFDPGLAAFSAIGYREAWAVLDGRISVDDAIAQDAQRNRAFARRQRTWFRAEPGIEWLDAAGDALSRALEVAFGLARVAPLVSPRAASSEA
jgi:tRNA dimethylallyltransferase